MVSGKLENPVLFICDLQERFRAPIHEFEKCVATAQKLINACKTMSIPFYVTTQNRSRLGPTVPELPIDGAAGVYDKTLFSMMVPELVAAIGPARRSVAIVGIESHVCVLQTALDLMRAGHAVYVMADGVSSCNRQEVAVALERVRREGGVVTTSESWIFEVLGDAGASEFREISALIKETKPATLLTLQSLL